MSADVKPLYAGSFDPVAVIKSYPDRAAWLAARHGPHIGASDCYDAIHRPYAVWVAKTLPVEDKEPTGDMRWGTLLEPVVREEYARMRGIEIYYPGPYTIAWSEETPWLCCSLDGLIGDDGIYEGKTSSLYASASWDDSVPDRYFWQAQHAMAATGRKFVEFACLLGKRRMEMRRVDRNDDCIGVVLEAGAQLVEHIKSGVPPKPDGSEQTRAAIARLHPDDNGETVTLNDDMQRIAALLEHTKKNIKSMEALRGEYENQIRAAIGPNTFATFPNGWTASYKTTERDGYVVKAAKYRTLRINKEK